MVFEIKGAKLFYQNRDLMNLKLALVGGHEYEVTDFFLRNLHESDVFLDVGANIGYYTVMAAKRLYKGTVVAVEPADINLSCLKKNIRLNELNNVLLIQRIARRESDLTLPMYLQDSWNLGSISARGCGAVECWARTISIDDLIRQFRLEKVDIIKIDVEGSEYEVLLGMQNSLRHANYRPRFIGCAMDNEDEWLRPRSYDLVLAQGYVEVDFNQKPIERRDCFSRGI
jgi:FkbM family methyltransferase